MLSLRNKYNYHGWAAACLARSTSRQARTTRPPCLASSKAVNHPIPELPPVTMATLPEISGSWSSVHFTTSTYGAKRVTELVRGTLVHMSSSAPAETNFPGIRTRVWRNGVLEREDFPFEEVSDYLEDPECLVWADLCAPDDATLAQLAEELCLDALPPAMQHGRALLEAGADIIDVGGESTRPGAAELPPGEE